jgi:hypothetical protein
MSFSLASIGIIQSPKQNSVWAANAGFAFLGEGLNRFAGGDSMAGISSSWSTPALVSSSISFSIRRMSDLIGCLVSAPIVTATNVSGLKPRGARNVAIISSIGLLCPRSSFET